MEYYRTIKLKVNCNPSDLKRLHLCNLESAELWNFFISKNDELYRSEGKLLNKKELQDLAKDYKTKIICSNNKRILSIKVLDTYRAISKARKSGRTDIRYPYKNKKFFPTEWDYQFLFPDYQNNTICLTTSRYIDEQSKKRNGKQIKLKFKTPIPQNIKTLKLIFEHGSHYACISYIIELPEVAPLSNNTSSIDLGEIHAITSIDNNDNQIIITGRKIRSTKQFRNKKQAELRSKMDKCKKGSRQWKKYKYALNYVKSKTRRQLDYQIHKLTRLYADWAKEKGISLVFCGDVTNIELNTNNSGSKITRQKINQWEYGKIMYLLGYKLGIEGIEFLKVPEKYSSQICPCCGFKTKPKGRRYECSNCQSEFHRDIVGAYNILRFNHEVSFTPQNNLKYLRIS